MSQINVIKSPTPPCNEIESWSDNSNGAIFSIRMANGVIITKTADFIDELDFEEDEEE